jgi:hypothetical protein
MISINCPPLINNTSTIGEITSGDEPTPLLVAGPGDASDRTLIHCPAPSLVGWARTLHPAYMGQ